MTLRRRLIAAMAVFVVIGLAVTDVVTYSAVHSFLYGRLDAQIVTAQRLASRYLYREASDGRPATSPGLDDRVGPSVYVMVLGPNGGTVVSRPSGTPLAPDPAPVLPRSLRLSTDRAPSSGPFRPIPSDFVLRSASGFRYRAGATVVPQGTLVTAVPLTSTDATLASLMRTELSVSLAVVVALCLLVLWTVVRGLRPLDDMAETAGAIASGDLTRRVSTDNPTSEVGRLGVALNAMLAQIEAAFSEKSASEARLRQFVADASHELRTPLTSIRGYAELLRKGAFASDEDRQRALARVEREAARMGGLVDDLLLLARLDQGRPLQRVPVDLRRIGQEAVDDARVADPDRPVDLQAPQPVRVTGDPDRLAQVAHNLVRNALVHTPAGTPVQVEVAAEGTVGVLRVVDEGPGLAPGETTRAFDRFYRGDQSRSGQGTGLGLSIVRAIAEALDGWAWAASELGHGAAFAVAVPLVVEGAGTSEVAPAGLPAAPPRSDGRARRRTRHPTVSGGGPAAPEPPPVAPDGARPEVRAGSPAPGQATRAPAPRRPGGA